MKKLTELLALTVAVMMLAVSFVLPSYAADLSKDGSYTVPVTLYHASKDKVSMGDKYIADTALITVENGKKYITVIADGVDDLTFSYYLDGSTEGETAKATEVKNVEIGGKTYSIGYKFPLVTDNQDVGVTFKAPIMPVSPSARLRIDYSKLKAVSNEEETTEETQTESEPATDKNGETVTAADETSEAAEENADQETTYTSASDEPVSVNEEEAGTADAEKSGSSPVIYVIIAAVVIAAAVIAAVVIKKKES